MYKYANVEDEEMIKNVRYSRVSMINVTLSNKERIMSYSGWVELVPYTDIIDMIQSKYYTFSGEVFKDGVVVDNLHSDIFIPETHTFFNASILEYYTYEHIDNWDEFLLPLSKQLEERYFNRRK